MISSNDLSSLIKKTDGPVVSLYIQANCENDGVQDKERLNNSLKNAESKLKNSGMKTSEATMLLEPGFIL